MVFLFITQKKSEDLSSSGFLCLVEATRFEPTTSASRIKDARDYAHISCLFYNYITFFDNIQSLKLCKLPIFHCKKFVKRHPCVINS